MNDLIENNKIILWKALTIQQRKEWLENLEFSYLVVTSPKDVKLEKVQVLIIDYACNAGIDHLLLALSWEKWAERLIVVSDPMPQFWTLLFPNAYHYQPKDYYQRQVQYYTGDLSEKINQVMLSKPDANYLVITEQEMTGEYSGDNVTISRNLANLPSYQYDYIFDEMTSHKKRSTITGGVRERKVYCSKDVYEARTRLSQKDSITFFHISKSDYQKLDRTVIPEIYQVPLHHVMLRLYQEKFSPFQILPQIGFSKEDLDFVYRYLVSEKVISITGKLNKSKSEKLLNLNLGLRPAFLSIYGSPTLAACIDCYRDDIFHFLKGSRGPVHQFAIDDLRYIREKYNRFRGESDCETLLHLYNSSLGQNLEKWSTKNGISLEYLTDLHQMLKGGQHVDIQEEIKGADPIIKKLYLDRRLDLDVEYTVSARYHIEAGETYNISSTSINLIEEKKPKELYSLISYRAEEVNSISLAFVPLE